MKGMRMMKTKRFLGSLFASALLASSLLTSSSISAAEDMGNYQWTTIKGTLSEIAEITQKNKLNEVPYPFQLESQFQKINNSALLDNYAEKQRVKKDFPAISKRINETPDKYAGHYYNADKGTVVIQITEDSESLKKSTLSSVQNDDKVEFEVKKFSWADIENAKEEIIKSVKPGTVRALIPDVKNNKLIIAFDEETMKDKMTVSSLVSHSDLLEFTTLPASALKVETDNTHYGSEFPMGAKLGGDYRNEGNTTRYSVCTAGYFATNASNKEVVVTSGHCQDKARTNTDWYQPTRDTSTIGKFTFRTESAGDGSNKAADAGYITFNSNYSGRARVPYPSASNMAMITGVYTADTPGDTVYHRGANSGGMTSGAIAYSNVDIYWGSGGYGYNRAEVLATGYTSQGGDSGGPILTNYAYNNALTGWTFDLAGTHTGSLTLDSTQSSIPPGTYKVYEPLWTTYTDLHLTGIQVLQP